MTVRAAAAGIPRLSTVRRERLGRRIGNLLRRIGPRQRRVESNLRLVFPDRSPEWIGATAERSYQHVARETLQTLRLASASRGAVLAMTEVSGLAALSQTLANGSGAVLVGAHIGNWEVGFAALALHGLPISLVFKPQANPLVHQWALSMRERWGIRMVDRAGVLANGYRVLADSEVLMLVADQHASWRKGIALPFFGYTVSAHRGPALFARRGAVPLFYFSCIRQDSDRYRLHIDQLAEASDPDETESDAVRRLTQLYLERIERDIVQWPEQYFWLHRRWRRIGQQAQ